MEDISKLIAIAKRTASTQESISKISFIEGSDTLFSQLANSGTPRMRLYRGFLAISISIMNEMLFT